MTPVTTLLDNVGSVPEPIRIKPNRMMICGCTPAWPMISFGRWKACFTGRRKSCSNFATIRPFHFRTPLLMPDLSGRTDTIAPVTTIVVWGFATLPHRTQASPLHFRPFASYSGISLLFPTAHLSGKTTLLTRKNGRASSPSMVLHGTF